MTEEKGIQITRGLRDMSRLDSRYGIEMSRTGKPISGRVPELLELDFRCGITHKGFRVMYPPILASAPVQNEVS